jgi:hypothetical protein
VRSSLQVEWSAQPGRIRIGITSPQGAAARAVENAQMLKRAPNCVQRRQSAPRFALPSSFEETPISLGTSVAFSKLKLLPETDRALPG